MRPIVAARGIGLAEGALMYATEYVKNRPAFGQTIADFQGIQWEIAKCAAEIEAAAAPDLPRRVPGRPGRYTKEYVPMLSMCKYYASEVAVRRRASPSSSWGRPGYMEEHPTEQYYRDARQLTIVEGTSQVQLGLIARGVLATTCGGTSGPAYVGATDTVAASVSGPLEGLRRPGAGGPRAPAPSRA